MKPSVVLYNNCIVALVCLFGWTVHESGCCDTKWIRMVFMMTCGRKKRTSVWQDSPPLNFSELPPDFEGALRYLKERDPHNPVFNDSSLWNFIDENPRVSYTQKLLIFDSAKDKSQPSFKSSPVFIRKLLPKVKNTNLKGIQGFPDEWDLQEIDDTERANTRRTIDHLMEECCKLPRVRTCDETLFADACK